MSVHPSIRPVSIALRSDVDRDSEPVIYSGSGAASGSELPTGQTLASGQHAIRVRSDGDILDVLQVTASGGSTWHNILEGSITDPGDAGAIPALGSGVCDLESGAAAETRTLATPDHVGQRLTLVLDTDGGGDIAVTASQAINVAGNTVMTFTTVGSAISLIGVTVVGSYRWRVVANDGVTLS